MNRFSLLTAIYALLAFHCSSTYPLSDAEKAKLDPPLIRLLTDDNTTDDRLPCKIRTDGTNEYPVIIRSKDPKDIKGLGISINSVFGDVITAYASIKEIRKLLSLPSVRALETGSVNKIQQ